jgi:pimeloyl-ACP methyl ester carboxylesterase
MAASAEKTVTYEGLTISYATHNLPPSPNQPVLIFIHGWCCSSDLWSTQSPVYTKYPSILLDLPGHGASSKPEDADYNTDFLARSIIAVLDAENISTVVLTGHSLGGFLATTLLRLLGEGRVKGIVYVHSFWLIPSHYLTIPQRAAWREALKDDATFWSMFESSFSHAKSSDQTVETVRRVMVEETPLHVRLSSGCTNVLPPHWRWEEVFASTPMLHITSREAAEWDEQYLHHIPNLKTEKWDNVSIFLHMDAAERFNERVGRFLVENSLV